MMEVVQPKTVGERMGRTRQRTHSGVSTWEKACAWIFLRRSVPRAIKRLDGASEYSRARRSLLWHQYKQFEKGQSLFQHQ
jgi:hypothetical protein